MSFKIYLLFLALPQFVGWLYQQKVKKADIVDVIWCTSFAVAAVVVLFRGDGLVEPRVIAGFFALFWAIRLASHLLLRSKAETEDRRYAGLREKLGAKASAGFFLVFQGQGILNAVLLSTVVVLAELTTPLYEAQFYVAIVIFALAIFGESKADQQLARFKKRPESRGKACKEGLWAYSRHPNYFFEWLYWWGYPVLALGSENWIYSLISPAIMYVFLNHITGVPYSEKMSLQSRGDEYRKYQLETSRFFIWFKKQSKSI